MRSVSGHSWLGASVMCRNASRNFVFLDIFCPLLSVWNRSDFHPFNRLMHQEKILLHLFHFFYFFFRIYVSGAKNKAQGIPGSVSCGVTAVEGSKLYFPVPKDSGWSMLKCKITVAVASPWNLCYDIMWFIPGSNEVFVFRLMQTRERKQ